MTYRELKEHLIQIGGVWYFMYGPYGTKKAAKEAREAMKKLELERK